jgi:transposase
LSIAYRLSVQTIYERLTRWRREGLFDRILDRLRLKLNAEGLIDLDLWCIDSTSVRASRSAAGARNKGIRRSQTTMRSASRGAASAPRSTW